MNIIFGKKESGQPKESINSIGKSTALDLIDYCLGASAQKQHNPRLRSAESVMRGYSIVLDFSIGTKQYSIERSLDAPSENFICEEGEWSDYSEKELKAWLSRKIFKPSKYEGVYNESWYRKLVTFFLKIQKFKKDRFLDPVKYIKEITESEINVYHFFLLGFDNTLATENFRHRVEKKKIVPTIAEVTRFVEEKYGLSDLKETQNEINKLRLDIRKLESSIEKFELEDQYQDVEREANRLTEQIKDFLYQSHLDKEKINSYRKSQELTDEISVRRITRIFKEIDEDFGKKVNVTLKEALNFRKDLAISRKEFLTNEIDRLTGIIQTRAKNVAQFEESRSKLFKFLSEKEAISDLTEAFYNLSAKRKDLGELDGNSKILTGLSTELAEIETEIAKLQTQSIKYLEDISEQLSTFYQAFNDVFNSIYVEDEGASNFSVTPNFKKDSILEISVSMPDMYGKGKNQGRTLVYDLALLIHSSEIEPRFPKFLIHDGIFDGMDKSHFISTYDLVESQVKIGKPIQYITTLNEEGTLSDKFGKSDLLTPEKIEDEAILVLTPSKKLFKEDF